MATRRQVLASVGLVAPSGLGGCLRLRRSDQQGASSGGEDGGAGAGTEDGRATPSPSPGRPSEVTVQPAWTGDRWTRELVGGDGWVAGGANGDGGVWVRDAADGSLRWSSRTGTRFGTDSLASDDKAVYAGTIFAAPPTLFALDRTSGDVRWSFDGEYDAFRFPTLASDMLVMAEGQLADGDVENRTRVHAIARSTGDRRWTVDGLGPSLYPNGLEVVASTVCVALGDQFRAFDLADGTERFARNWQTRGTAVQDGVVYLMGYDSVVAFDPADGSQRWRSDEVFTDPNRRPAVDGRRVFVGSEGSLVALDRTSGDHLWTTELTTPKATPPVVHDGIVWIADDADTLYAVEAGSGTVLLERGLDLDASAGDLHVTDDRVVVGAGPTTAFTYDVR